MVELLRNSCNWNAVVLSLLVSFGELFLYLAWVRLLVLSVGRSVLIR